MKADYTVSFHGKLLLVAQMKKKVNREKHEIYKMKNKKTES